LINFRCLLGKLSDSNTNIYFNSNNYKNLLYNVINNKMNNYINSKHIFQNIF